MKDIPAEEKKQMVADTIDHFDNYVSPGWLKYRKSVSSDSEQGAVLEWQDEGAYCYGLNGEKFIDCLGGFGIYTCGHRNPEILKTVKAQLDHQALHSQELLDPLRGYLAKALADITPGDLQYSMERVWVLSPWVVRVHTVLLISQWYSRYSTYSTVLQMM